jgi:hypothetical protein
MNKTTDISIWLDWENLYLDALIEQLTAEERRRLVVALENERFGATLSPALASKAERLVAFITTDEAPRKALLRAATTHLRQHDLRRRPASPSRRS